MFVTFCSVKPEMQSNAGGVRCVRPPVRHGLPAPAPWTTPLPMGAGGAEQHLVFHPGWAAGSQTPSWQPEKPLATQSINTPSPVRGWPPSLAVPSLHRGLGAAPQIVEVRAQKSTSRVASGRNVPVAQHGSLKLLPPKPVSCLCPHRCRGRRGRGALGRAGHRAGPWQ